MNLLHPIWAEINLNNLIYNIDQIKKKSGNSEIIGVVKANAYGHGAVEISKVLLNHGINRLAVANIVEAIELRENEIKAPIMLLGISEDYAIDALLEYDVEPTISTYEFAMNLNNKANALNKTVNIHIAMDSGMGRIGFRKNDKGLEDIINISKLSNLKIESIFSHFSTADSKDKSYSLRQLEIYNTFLDKLQEAGVYINKKNLSNSAAIIDLPESHYDYVRPGIIQYGYYPSDEVDKNHFDIKHVLTWKTKIIHIKEVEENEYIGYGQTFKTSRKTVVATLPVGYADGYSRGLSNKGKVIINGQLAPIIGNVCMDQFMVDITDIENVHLGNEVILLGSDGNVKFDADDIAKLTNTISYEVLCLIGRRAPRIYIKDYKTIGIRYLM
ncbi:alanine racemase [Clostridium tertium]|jgi:alanine racemase|uniref:Alanine racemase n=1 Tax=Clostridium tertium TaxID=1559 RepID=A0A9X4B150_9CLOT|nr:MULTISPECIES: alanine racemase [Clostridium]EEH98918.1 alanine racemase [Clostridium sp. 7_2_43FAA]MBS5307856.1 alanine racemase [Clostridium sp.]MBU6136096.1 alanine racemase [Clostridium tertium]MDB1923605.1 alanine racemase [Clostridium tertium]MDB1925689.1 alanine racemase [Clostridium tertium]